MTLLFFSAETWLLSHKGDLIPVVIVIPISQEFDRAGAWKTFVDEIRAQRGYRYVYHFEQEQDTYDLNYSSEIDSKGNYVSMLEIKDHSSLPWKRDKIDL